MICIFANVKHLPSLTIGWLFEKWLNFHVSQPPLFVVSVRCILSHIPYNVIISEIQEQIFYYISFPTAFITLQI